MPAAPGASFVCMQHHQRQLGRSSPSCTSMTCVQWAGPGVPRLADTAGLSQLGFMPWLFLETCSWGLPQPAETPASQHGRQRLCSSAACHFSNNVDFPLAPHLFGLAMPPITPPRAFPPPASGVQHRVAAHRTRGRSRALHARRAQLCRAEPTGAILGGCLQPQPHIGLHTG